MASQLVGILNVTPDSFSDGGAYAVPELAVKAALDMVKQGASVIDVGAESTRPGAASISPEEEWRRLAPVLEALQAASLNAWLSIDTRHSSTAQRALLYGIDWLNDVSGFTSSAMLKLAQEHEVHVVAMHQLGVPADPARTLPESSDVVAEIQRWAAQALERLTKAGIAEARIILDPGIGFGKTKAQNWALIDGMETLVKTGGRWLVGHSRKSFLVEQKTEPNAVRDEKTCAVTQQLSAAGVNYVRVHNVAANAKALNIKPREHAKI